MILLDTNVVSEPLKPLPSPAVLAWIDAQAVETLYLSAITLAELRFGIAIMPVGKRKNSLRQQLEERVLPLFAARILPFDTCAANAHAALRARARVAGFAMGLADAYIAAIAAAHGFTIATRDTKPFQISGLNVVDPWLVQK